MDLEITPYGKGVSALVRVYGIFGDPIEHSLSPLLHNVAFKVLEMNAVYLPFLVTAGNLSGAVQAIRSLELGGVNITIPHKQAVTAYLDHLQGDALLTGSVNTIVNKDGVLYGYSTDGDGLLLALEREAGFSPRGKKVLLLGAGGAARAVAFALVRAEAVELCLVNRTLQRAEALAEQIKDKTGFAVQLLSYEDPALVGYLGETDLVVNATSVGMHPQSETAPPLPLDKANPACLVYDLVYRPPETELLKKAKKHGLKTLNGLGMLLYQGMLAFQHWTGVEPPEKPMRMVMKKFLETELSY